MSQHDISSTFSWSTHTVADVCTELKTSADGLQADEARERLQDGRNELPKQPPASAVKLFFDQLSSPLMAILIVAGLMSGFLGEWLDAGVIIFAVLLNAGLGFFEEYKADRSLEALNAFLPDEVHVRRDGVVSVVDARDIVPGDIVLLKTGDKITADGRLMVARSVEVNEAPLTGESRPVKKHTSVMTGDVAVTDRENMVFAGTVIVAGRAEYVVTETGVHTQIGQISSLLKDVEDGATPLQLQLMRFARLLGGSVLVLAFVVFLVGLWKGFEAVEMFQIAVAIAVSAVPEGMVVAMTVILAIGMQRVLKKQALVRRLVGVETLGSVSVICMDKTGTLTTGEMDVVLVEGDESRVYQIMKVTNSATSEKRADRMIFVGSPTEVAMARASADVAADTYRVVHELPFDSARKYKAALAEQGGDQSLFVIGAPEILMKRVDASDAETQRWLERIDGHVTQGLRVLLVCERTVSESLKSLTPEQISDLSIVGLIGLEDPLRDSARDAVDQARGAGLRPIMITGDHPETALVIARRVGLAEHADQVISGMELDALSDTDLQDRIDQISVFARVLPRHKLRLVRAWQSRNASVAMVGDGVNDAPALKAADIGVALGSGTEVTKEAADMVLLDNRFGTIVDAIREGRVMFDNIRKMITYLLSDSFSAIILILAALLIGVPMPLLPAQILWINLVADGFSSIALSFERGEEGVMQEPPRAKDESLLNTEMKIIIFVIGIVTDFLLLGIYLFYYNQELASIDHIRTLIFCALGMASLFYVFAVRKFRTNIFRSNPFENKWLILGTLAGFVFLMAPLFIPPLRNAFSFTMLDPGEWVLVAAFGLLNLLLIELVKSVFIRLHRKVDRT